MLVIPTRVKVVVVISALVLAAGLLTLALLPNPTQAQATVERIQVGPNDPFINEALLNPCTGETVFITGTATGFIDVVTTPSGQTNSHINIDYRGKGEGSEGNSYIFQQPFHQVVSGGLPITETAQLMVFSKGSGNNFALNQVIHVSPNGDVQSGVANPVCRGATAPHPPPPGTASATATDAPTATAKAQPRP